MRALRLQDRLVGGSIGVLLTANVTCLALGIGSGLAVAEPTKRGPVTTTVDGQVVPAPEVAGNGRASGSRRASVTPGARRAKAAARTNPAARANSAATKRTASIGSGSVGSKLRPTTGKAASPTDAVRDLLNQVPNVTVPSVCTPAQVPVAACTPKVDVKETVGGVLGKVDEVVNTGTNAVNNATNTVNNIVKDPTTVTTIVPVAQTTATSVVQAVIAVAPPVTTPVPVPTPAPAPALPVVPPSVPGLP